MDISLKCPHSSVPCMTCKRVMEKIRQHRPPDGGSLSHMSRVRPCQDTKHLRCHVDMCRCCIQCHPKHGRIHKANKDFDTNTSGSAVTRKFRRKPFHGIIYLILNYCIRFDYKMYLAYTYNILHVAICYFRE